VFHRCDCAVSSPSDSHGHAVKDFQIERDLLRQVVQRVVAVREVWAIEKGRCIVVLARPALTNNKADLAVYDSIVLRASLVEVEQVVRVVIFDAILHKLLAATLLEYGDFVLVRLPCKGEVFRYHVFVVFIMWWLLTAKFDSCFRLVVFQRTSP